RLLHLRNDHAVAEQSLRAGRVIDRPNAFRHVALTSKGRYSRSISERQSRDARQSEGSCIVEFLHHASQERNELPTSLAPLMLRGCTFFGESPKRVSSLRTR